MEIKPDTPNNGSRPTEVFVKEITFNDGHTFEFDHSDIIVFTGANNAGKSQVLREIKTFFEDQKRPRLITNVINAEYIGDVSYLKEKSVYRINSYWLEDIQFGNINNLDHFWTNHQLSSISRYFINHLSTEERLQTANPPQSFNVLEQDPTHPIQKLYVDDTKEVELSALFHKAFNANIIVNRGAGSNIPIHVGIKPEILQGEDRVSFSYLTRLKELPQLQNQGDGMRSFAGILLNVFTSHHTITLIDEPEAFLHPPQARLLGKMLAKNTPNNRQLFLSTHSEDFLKGLLDADNENVKIIRIDREENINHMSILKNDEIKQFWKDPILRYSNILSGLFHSKVVICEGDTDCRFYQAIMNALHDGEDEISPDILFTHCGGKQRLKTVIAALKALKVKVVAVTDIDVLNNKNTFKDLVTSLEIDWNTLDRKWNIINDYVKNQRAQLDTADVKDAISKLLNDVEDDQFPQDVAAQIKKTLKSSTAWSKIKEVGKTFFTGDAYTAFVEIDKICKLNGLFIVPVGELEFFYRPDSNHGTKWVNNVLENVDLKNESELRSAREFIKEIIDF